MRGGTCDSLQNHLKHRFTILQNIIVPETQHTIPQSFKSSCAPYIFFYLFGMLPTVQLYDQSRIATDEINDVTINFMLSPELPSA